MTLPSTDTAQKPSKGKPSELSGAAHLGWLMALHDTRQRYRGSILGPLWLTANLAATAFGVTFIYAALFNEPYQDYLAYLMTGLVAWSFIFATLSEASSTFIAAAGVIRNVRLPILAYVFRVLFRQGIILAHNLAVLAIVLVVTAKGHLGGVPLAIANLALIGLAVLPAIAILAMLGARFRDVPQIVTNLLAFIMFLTPIFWKAEAATGRGTFIQSNPFHHLIAIFRQPLLGQPVEAHSYLVVLGLIAGGTAIAAAAYAWRRDRIVFWV